jgi:hypothetical protein
MARLLSGSTLRAGGSGEFISLETAQPQLPATDTTETGFTLVTNDFLQTTYRSSLGYIAFTSATMFSQLPQGTIKILYTGTDNLSTGTSTGLLVVEGDVGVGGAMNIGDDITVNGITVGRGFEGENNLVFRGTATEQINAFNSGQLSIAIGYDTLQSLETSYKNLAIGRYALSSGTNLRNNVAIGDSALKLVGVYTTTGTLSAENVAIGVDAGVELINGQQNVFIGHEAANLLTTGSYNIIIGPLTGQYLYTGSGIISIGGDNIVDGKDDQVNIGSVFYYDGTGYAYVSAETHVGLGSRASVVSTGTFTSSSTVTGGLVVVGGIFGWDNLILADTFQILGTGTSTIAGPLVPTNPGSTLGTAEQPFGALYVSGETVFIGTVTLKSSNPLDFKVESTAGFVTQTVGNIFLNSGAISTAFNNGSLVVTGGIGLAGGLNVGGTHDVDISPTGADVLLKPGAGGTVEIRPNSQGNIDNMVIGANDAADATFVNAVSSTVDIISTASSTSTTTGVLTVAGGVGIRGDVYANSGHPDENYMLYTPRATVSTTSPSNPRIGDFWINPLGPYFLQYVLDGANKIWVQIT